MDLTQPVSLMLSGVLAASSCTLAWAQNNGAAGAASLPAQVPVPRRAGPQPSWPEPPKAPVGAPNVVLILLDDAGFAATSTFGGPVATPNLDKLAQSGLRYNSFHVNALCSPTRASLLTGRNNHQVGFGSVAEWASSYPGYSTVLPKSAATVAEVLKENGYSTGAFGKWHNTPLWEVSPAGPFDRWPTGLGFEHFYGFNQAADNQYTTRIYRDTTPVEPAKTEAQGYHFTTDFTNEAINWLHQHDAVAGDRPFFLYYATGATHAPHQVPQKWIEKYKGKFDKGWDVMRQEAFARQKALGVIPANADLTPRPPGLPAWDSLTPQQKKLMAHQMEVYAGYLEQTDYEIGRLLDAIHDEGQTDNTVVMEIAGDNGASAEGGLEGYDAYDIKGKGRPVEARLEIADLLGSETYINHYAAAWAWALDSPFQGAKQDAAHLGGTTDPLVISWPGHIKDAGGLRSQFSHVTDIAPTIYEIAGITPPAEVNGVKQIPLEGKSLVYTIDHADAPTRHTLQYFETSGNRGIYKDGWWAGNRYRSTWPRPDDPRPGQGIDVHPWELYNLNDDYSQAHDLAAQYPDKLKELEQVFDEEAARNQVYPLNPRRAYYPYGPAEGKTVFTYRSGVERLPWPVAPVLYGRAYTITADVDVPKTGGDGVIMAQGGNQGGIALYVRNRHVVYEVNAYQHDAGQIVSRDLLQPGKAHIVVNVTLDSNQQPQVDVLEYMVRRPISGSGQLFVNGKDEGQAKIANVNASINETLDIGSDLGSPVSSDYKSPNRFTGTIDKVAIELK